MNHHPENPSRYNTNRYPTYTRAEPVSLSPRMASIGSPIIRATDRKPFLEARRNPCRLITMASMSEVVIFDTSAGWNFTGPNSNHECEPFTSLLTKITSTSRQNTTRYATGVMTSQSRGLMANKISASNRSATTIHTNCFPLLHPGSNMDEGSVECTEAYMLTQPMSTMAI